MLKVKTLQSLILKYRMVNFVYHHWGCTLYINLSAIALAYPFRSLQKDTKANGEQGVKLSKAEGEVCAIVTICINGDLIMLCMCVSECTPRWPFIQINRFSVAL